MQLQLNSCWASRLCFLCISQFFQYTFQIPFLGKGLDAAASAASPAPDVKFWYPQLRDKSFDQLSRELNPASGSEGSSSQSKLLGLVRFKPSSKLKAPADFDPENIPENDPIQPFLKKLNPRDEQQISSFIVHQATKKLWDSSNPTTNELNRWLHVLERAVHSDHSPQPTILISAMYDLKSLRVKFAENPNFLQRIENVEGLIKNLLKSYKLVAAESLPWAKEIFFPSKGFSNELANIENLKTLVQNDQTFYIALTELDLRRNMESIQTIRRDFKKYSSYKRVLSLAIYYHLTKPMRAEPYVKYLFQQFLDNNKLLPHEQYLARLIVSENKLSIPI